MKKFLLFALRYLSIFGLLATLTLSIIGYFGTWLRHFELASHFKVQYLEIAAACLIALLALRTWRWAAVALMGVALNAAVIIPWFYPSSHPNDSPPDLRLVLANVNGGNTNYPALLNLIATEDPDIIVIQEADERWVEALKALASSHPFTRFIANRDNTGIMLRSRFPVEPIDDAVAQGCDFPIIIVRIKIKEVTASLITLHPPPPVTQTFLSERNHQLAQVANLVKRLPQPVIVAGDLNISLWSPYYSRFVDQSGLVAARQSFGILPTYPTHNRLVMIPIDHCLVTSDIKVTNCRTGREISSDHLPILIDLAFSELSRKN
jgi:endonuclease/exonuclease/phosphatase (EEP) superfamily protein YafD